MELLGPSEAEDGWRARMMRAPLANIHATKAFLLAVFAPLGLFLILGAAMCGVTTLTGTSEGRSSSANSENSVSRPAATPVVESWLDQLVSLRANAPYERKAHHKRADTLPVCGLRPILPIPDLVEQVRVKESSKNLHAWRFDSHSAGCQLRLRTEDQLGACLRGKWVAVIGASQSSIWAVQLVNMLSPGALDANRNGFISDGVFFQMLDVIIEDSKVINMQVVYSSDPHAGPGDRGRNFESHSVKKVLEVLPGVHNKLIRNVPHRHNRIRITYFLAEYWDEVPLHLDAICWMQHGWQHSKVFTTIAVGTWYAYAAGCSQPWCKTRLSVSEQPGDRILDMFQQDMWNVMPAIKSFCTTKGGRGAALGCTLASIEYCSGLSGNHEYVKIYEAFKHNMSKQASDGLRFLDLWQLSMQMPEECLHGHFSPASATFTLQLLFSSVCSPKHVANGVLAAWQGEACRSDQISAVCKDRSCQGYHYTWDWALSKPCRLRPAHDVPKKQTASGAGDWGKYAAYSQFSSAGI